MSKLVQKVVIDIMDFSLGETYIYGEATLKENLSMQEPLEKLYQYENQPTIEEFISKFKNEYYHKVGIQFDNAIIEMEKVAERMKK